VSADEQAGLFDLLEGFGSATTAEILNRLRDPHPDCIGNLLLLVRMTGDETVVPELEPLLRHPDERVREEALMTLLSFRHEGAVERLREELRSPDTRVFLRAATLAGRCGVTDLTGTLAGALKNVSFSKSAFEVNEVLVRVLGELGDTRAVPELERLASTKCTLYPQRLFRLKTALFRSLGGYPRQSVAKLLRMGTRSGSRAVRRQCKTWLAEIES
jgi:HEAT repeat protein